MNGTANSLSRDTYYRNLTLNAGASLNTNGFRLFVSNTLTLNTGANIGRDGAFCGVAGEPALAPGTLGGSGQGGCMGGAQGTTNSLGGDGGPAFCFPPGGFVGVGGGTASPPGVSVGGRQIFDGAIAALSGRTLDGALVTGGAGGAGCNEGVLGAGGSGGGVVIVAARTVVVVGGSATITANGGGGFPGVGGGSGGGGGGGVVVVISSSAQPAGLTLTAAGGGPDGTDGSTAWLN
jgi:hypothetical protein